MAYLQSETAARLDEASIEERHAHGARMRPEQVDAIPPHLMTLIAQTQSQLDRLYAMARQKAHQPIRGGLSPCALRRVTDYIEAHLEQSIDLMTLAAVAGLSVSHFSRAFKQSQGVSPHDYLIQRRVERARELVITSTLPLSEIAIVSGFADQSHFTRHFGRRLGTSPNAMRRAMTG